VVAGGAPGAQNVTTAAANARGVPSLAAATNTGAPGSATGPLLAGASSSASSGSSTSRITPNLPAGPNGARLVQLAQSQLGARYTWAGVSPATGFDCSGFVYWAYNSIGYSLPRTMEDQFASGRRVTTDQLRPGDIIFFSDTYTSGLSHDGIYIGDGKFIHAVDESTGVAVTPLDSAYWRERYSGAVHVVD
jgi:cell wall-associated NlpC family hydrolase